MPKHEFNVNCSYDEHGSTLLIAASSNGHLDIVSYLLKKGAIVDKRDKYGVTAVYYAARRRHLDVLRLLLESGGDPSVQPYDTENHPFPLFQATAINHPEVCEILLKFGAKLDQKFKGFNSLEAATIHNKHKSY